MAARRVYNTSMICPSCSGTDLLQSSKFDLTVVDVDECRHDFECCDCRSLFSIVYAPVGTVMFEYHRLPCAECGLERPPRDMDVKGMCICNPARVEASHG